MGLGARRLGGTILTLGGLACLASLSAKAATSDPRTISLYHIHTKETLTVLYRKDGKYLPEALQQINWIMRDWRKNEAITIDPAAIDLIWEMHAELGSHEPVHIICGYRSRDTNEMLRKTVGGQASQSQHITGKAIDVSFPDVPVRQMRYSALIRERGGVGYYPTSAIPFVHVDTGRVRHWPRLPRDELALLFPSGRTRHHPAEGGPISPADVVDARKTRKDLALEVAQYFDVRARPKASLVMADAGGLSAVSPPVPKPATRPTANAPERRMSVGAPPESPEAARHESTPRLVAEPRLVERPTRFTPRLAEHDRSRLDMLVTLASLETPSVRNGPGFETGALEPRASATALKQPVLAGAIAGSLAPASDRKPPASPNLERKIAALEPMPAGGTQDTVRPDLDAPTAWATAPAYDDEHPEELSYRPFPLAPLLTASASPDDPVLTAMVHPRIAETLEVLDDTGSVLPMRLRPGRQAAGLVWAQEFRGQAVGLAELDAAEPPNARASALLANRSVKTTTR